MTEPATVAHTRDPLPAGAPATLTPVDCRTCQLVELVFSAERPAPFTRSVEPGPDGRYEVTFHHDWCPVFTGEQPEVACPTCRAPVESLTFRPGYVVTVPHGGPYGGPGHYVGTLDGDEIPTAAMTWESTRKREPRADKVDVQPCGHTLEGDDAHQVAARFNQVCAEHAERAALATIGQHAALLDAAERAGHGKVAQLYRRAVRTGSADASGLLAALEVLAGDA